MLESQEGLGRRGARHRAASSATRRSSPGRRRTPGRRRWRCAATRPPRPRRRARRPRDRVRAPGRLHGRGAAREPGSPPPWPGGPSAPGPAPPRPGSAGRDARGGAPRLRAGRRGPGLRRRARAGVVDPAGAVRRAADRGRARGRGARTSRFRAGRCTTRRRWRAWCRRRCCSLVLAAGLAPRRRTRPRRPARGDRGLRPSSRGASRRACASAQLMIARRWRTKARAIRRATIRYAERRDAEFIRHADVAVVDREDPVRPARQASSPASWIAPTIRWTFRAEDVQDDRQHDDRRCDRGNGRDESGDGGAGAQPGAAGVCGCVAVGGHAAGIPAQRGSRITSGISRPVRSW